ncbi:MAG: TIGR01841 family phasin [Pseudomonadota bacterium]
MAEDKTNPYFDMFQSFGKNMNIPGPDVNDIMDMHRKNLAALQAATQVGTQGAQSVMDTQRKNLEAALSDIAASVESASKSADYTQMMLTPLDIAKKSFDATMKNTTEVAEIVKQGNMDAFNILKDRVVESVQEMTGQSSDED